VGETSPPGGSRDPPLQERGKKTGVEDEGFHTRVLAGGADRSAVQGKDSASL